MQKDEIIQLHSFLLQVRSFLENAKNKKDADAFSSYESLKVSPQHVFKLKDVQKTAVFELCNGISYLLNKEH